MNFQGIFTWVSPKVGGTSKAGNAWEKVEVVVTEDVPRYPSQLLFTAMNDRLQQFKGIKLGDRVSIDYDARVRDWTDKDGNLRKSMDLQIYTIAKVGEAQQPAAPAQAPARISFTQPDPAPLPAENDDLPF